MEAHLFGALREAGHLLLSMVAEEDGEIVGHIAFSPVRLEPDVPPLNAAALGPIAVSPAHQRAGIGGKLILEGLERLRASGVACVVPLGEPDNYARFGFVPASSKGVLRPEDPPDHVSRFLQVVELAPNALAGVRLRVFYADEFTTVRAG